MPSKGPNTGFQPIKRRQRRILHLIAEGYKDEEIAKELHITLETVKNDQESAKRRFDVHNVSCLIDYALRNGVVNLYEILESRFWKKSKTLRYK